MKQVNIGIIGLGRIGKLHADNIKSISNMTLVAVADVQLDQQWLDHRNIPHIYNDPQAAIDNPEVDAILICSPAQTHTSLIIAAAEHSKHVFCEKPIALDIEAITHAIDAADKAKIKLQIGFNRRFDPNFAKIQKAVKNGDIGNPHLIRITSYDPAPPPIEYIAQSGGIFLDMSIHDFDMARFLSGSEVTEVYASGAVLVDPEIGKQGDIDTAIIQLRFANGALGAIQNSRQAVYGYDQRIEVFGSKGNIEALNNCETNTVLSTIDGVMSDKPLYFFLERYRQSYINELSAFRDSIIDNNVSPVNGHDGLMPILIAYAAKQSYDNNIPVKVEQR